MELTISIKKEDCTHNQNLQNAVKAYKEAKRGQKRKAFFDAINQPQNQNDKVQLQNAQEQGRRIEELEEQIHDEQLKAHESLTEVSLLRDYIVILLRENKDLQSIIDVYKRG